MGRIFPTIGCCLLLALPAAGCAQRPAPSSGVADSVSAQLHQEMDRQVALAAAEAYGWNPADVVVEPLSGTGSASCRLLRLHSPSALPNHARTWAVVDGEVMIPGNADALARVLDGCGADGAAEVWAEAVAAFGADVPPGYVVRRKQEVSSLAHRHAMEDGGYALHPPRFTGEDGEDRTVEFFLTDFEATTLYRVVATRSADGDVQVSSRPAGGD